MGRAEVRGGHRVQAPGRAEVQDYLVDQTPEEEHSRILPAAATSFVPREVEQDAAVGNVAVAFGYVSDEDEATSPRRSAPAAPRLGAACGRRTGCGAAAAAAVAPAANQAGAGWRRRRRKLGPRRGGGRGRSSRRGPFFFVWFGAFSTGVRGQSLEMRNCQTRVKPDAKARISIGQNPDFVCFGCGLVGLTPGRIYSWGEMPQENPLSTQPSLSRFTNRLVTSRLPVLDLALPPAVQSDLAP